MRHRFTTEFIIDTSTACPSPVRSRCSKAARIPASRCNPLPESPDEAPDKEFISEEIELDDNFDEEYDLDPEDYDSLDFDENWN